MLNGKQIAFATPLKRMRKFQYMLFKGNYGFNLFHFLLLSTDKTVQTTERLVQRQEPFKNLLNQRTENVLVQRSAQTSVSQHFVERQIVEREFQQERYAIKPVTRPIAQIGAESSHNSSIVSLVEGLSVFNLSEH
jgi:hypothetical protein